MPAERGASPRTPWAGTGQQPAAWRTLHRRRWVQRGFGIALLVGVGALLVTQARHVDWPAVADALRAYRWPTLLGAALLAALSHAVYSGYDLIGRRLTQHPLSRTATLSVAFVCYVFNLNFGSLVGGVAMRLRLYGRLGLKPGVVTRVLGLSVLTNWLGYAVLAGVCLLGLWLPLPRGWGSDGGNGIDGMGAMAQQGLGVLLLGAAAAYVLACAKARRRHWQWRSHKLSLPSWRMAALQLALSSCHWLLVAGMVAVLLDGQIGGQIAYGTVLSVVLVAAVAGVLTHVPAGLGVLEAVFLALLWPYAQPDELLATLLAYRGIYYLAPLLLALPASLWIERRPAVLLR